MMTRESIFWSSRFQLVALLGPPAALGLWLTGAVALAASNPMIVTLTQVGCQFIESENGIDHMYKTAKFADCKDINAKTGSARLAKAKVLRLKPGPYIFRVTNKNVPYGLGFWLRGKGLGRLTLPSVSGGGMNLGVTLEYKITLKPGTYLYSCPLNPTPDYRLVVEG